ncbi:MAG: response regulator, partial [Saprospiraceae bacterium]
QNSIRNQILLGALGGLGLLTAVYLWYLSKQRTRKKEAELALILEQEKSQTLKELDQFKSNFFANISHEFRTPLTLILSPLKDMKNGTFDGNKERYIKMMYRNASRLLDLVNQLLDLSKLESKKMTLKLTKGDITPYLKGLIYAFESLAVTKNIKYEIDFKKESLVTCFDKDKIQKIVNNLLSNAFKYTHDDGTINVVFDTDGNYLILTVSDTGIGIPESQLNNIFDRFYQGQDTEEGTYDSSGIGLHLTKELIELHHGKIHVNSELDKGSNFIVNIPIDEDIYKDYERIDISLDENIPSVEVVALEKVSVQKTYIPLESKQILVVEDNPDVRAYIKDILEKEYQVVEAANGKIGLEKASELMPDLILSDVMMPEMDGFELGSLLRKNEKTSHIPIILLTARSMQEDRIEGLERGVDAYLTKPFDSEELLVRVRKLIEQRERLKISFKGNSLIKSNDNITTLDEELLKRAVNLVHENMEDEDFSVSILGTELNMSRSQLFRKIKALTGDSPSIFIRTIRLNQAKYLLEKNAGNVSEISFRTGFNSLAYFNRCFKEQFGMNPSEILKKK